MNKIKYDSDLMKLINFFESITRAKVKDCIANERLIFIVEENEIGKAIGKNGIYIKMMEKKLKRKIKLVEFSNDVLQFVKNMIYPIEAMIEQDGAIIKIHGKDTGTKAMLIGRGHHSINHLTGIVKRYFDIEDIKVI